MWGAAGCPQAHPGLFVWAGRYHRDPPGVKQQLWVGGQGPGEAPRPGRWRLPYRCHMGSPDPWLLHTQNLALRQRPQCGHHMPEALAEWTGKVETGVL